MGDTFNKFVAFISDDPIMLGLCIAIIVLVILFIVVLCLGNNKKEVKVEKKVDNTTELLKTEINMDALKSTQEYNLSEIQKDQTTETQVADGQIEPSVMEVPVTTEEPVALEIENIQTPHLEGATSILNMPKFDSIKIDTEKDLSIDYDKIKESIVLSNTDEDLSKNEIIENMPILDLGDSEPVKEQEIKEEKPIIPEVKKEEEDLDDIALPKLNPNATKTSFMNSIQGESFNLK